MSYEQPATGNQLPITNYQLPTTSSQPMRIHHLNCGSLHPYWPRIDSIVYCLLLESSEGLVLVDTGFGEHDCRWPTPLMRIFTGLLRAPRDLAETAAAQVRALGYAPVSYTHLRAHETRR